MFHSAIIIYILNWYTLIDNNCPFTHTFHVKKIEFYQKVIIIILIAKFRVIFAQPTFLTGEMKLKKAQKTHEYIAGIINYTVALYGSRDPLSFTDLYTNEIIIFIYINFS